MAPSDKPSPDTPSSGPFQSNPGTVERRRRSRLNGTTEGWVLPDSGDISDPWEVRVHNVSRHGVGFESSEQFNSGDIVRIRIGRGPLELTRRVRVIRCNPGHSGTFTVGGEFV